MPAGFLLDLVFKHQNGEMEVVCSSQTMAHPRQHTWHYIREDGTFHTYCENPVPYKIGISVCITMLTS
jgi:hypothetical protein